MFAQTIDCICFEQVSIKSLNQDILKHSNIAAKYLTFFLVLISDFLWTAA